MSTVIGTPDYPELQRRWKWFVVLGAIAAILGLIALWNAVDATLVTTVFIGFVLVAAGIAQMIGAFTADAGGAGSRLLHIALGVLYVLIGVELVADPLRGAVALTVVIAAMLIIEGIIRLVTAFTAAGAGHRGLLVVIGVINILLGAWIWTGIPYSGVAIGIFVGIELLMAGIAWIIVGFAARSQASPAAA